MGGRLIRADKLVVTGRAGAQKSSLLYLSTSARIGPSNESLAPLQPRTGTICWLHSEREGVPIDSLPPAVSSLVSRPFAIA